MIKITKIEYHQNGSLICTFNNGEVRIFDISKIQSLNDRFIKNIIREDKVKYAAIGQLGELLFENSAEIKERDGTVSICDYDFSPEFVYHNSEKV